MVIVEPHTYRSERAFLSTEECTTLIQEIHSQEQHILNIPNTTEEAQQTEYTGLTQKYSVYNWLENSVFHAILTPKLQTLQELQHIPRYAVQCWVNKLHFNEFLPLHCHEDEDTTSRFYASTVFLGGPVETGTWYEPIGIRQNSIGELQIASSDVLHKVPKHLFKEPRISLAMDIIIDKHKLQDIEEKQHAGILYERRFMFFENANA